MGEPSPFEGDEVPGVSLRGEEGKEVALNLSKLSCGMVTVEELGPSYYRAEDGSLGLVVDQETFDAFAGRSNQKP